MTPSLRRIYEAGVRRVDATGNRVQLKQHTTMDRSDADQRRRIVTADEPTDEERGGTEVIDIYIYS